VYDFSGGDTRPSQPGVTAIPVPSALAAAIIISRP
jgi:hypothetical protein